LVIVVVTIVAECVIWIHSTAQ